MSGWDDMEADRLRQLRQQRQAMMERDELARQLEQARSLACHYHELLHQTHERPFIIERDGKTR